MAGGGGGASLKCLLVVSLVLLSSNLIAGHVYIVGGHAGWTYNINWPPVDQTFEAGDTLVFKYSAAEHNVAKVDANGYRTCAAPANSKVYSSGHDRIKLHPGNNYFICEIGSHCSDAGMKIVVNAK